MDTYAIRSYINLSEADADSALTITDSAEWLR